MINHLRRVTGVESDDAPDLKLAKIEQLLSVEDRSEGRRLMATLFSLPLANGDNQVTMSPARQRARTMELLNRQMYRLAAEKPVLLVVEDAHWLDPTTEEMLSHLLDQISEHRIMMLATTRPDYASTLVDHPQAMTLMLGRLSPPHARQMISDVSGNRTLPAELVDHILLKTDGVPLFIEELTKDILETTTLDEATAPRDGIFSDSSIPSTLADTLRARIDRLSSVREVMQVGAAIGRSFSYAVIEAIVRPGEELLRRALDRLVEAKLIYQHGAPPDAVYAFRHVLLQDAAYESMLRNKRISLHARIVSVIENQFPGIAESEPELIADHCSRAELGEKAIRCWLKAGANALGRSANLEAINHLRAGLQQLHAVVEDDKRARLELDLQLTLGQALIAARGYTAAETKLAFVRADQLLSRVGDLLTVGDIGQHYSALYGIFVGHLIGGHIDSASDTIDRILRLSSDGDDDAYSCLAHRLSGSLAFFRGDLQSAQSNLQKAIELYAPAQRRLALHFGPDTGSAAMIFLSMTEWLRGNPQSALRTAQIAIDDAHRLENALTLGQVLTLAAQLHYMAQDYESMLRLAKQGYDNCEQNGIRYFGAICQLYQIWGQAWSSNSPNCIDKFRRSLAAYEDMKCGLQVALFRGMLGQLLLAADEPRAAAKECELALANITVNGERWWAPEIYRTLGDALLALSNAELVEAENCFRRAVAAAQQTGALMLELRASARLAQIKVRQHDKQEAQRILESALDKFDVGVDGGELRAALAFLREIS
jgi:tetratricopeptide (TPR) repeat protein